MVTLLIRNTKKSYYKTELRRKAENNSKLKWKLIGDQIGKNKKQQTIHKILTKNGIEINFNEHPKLIAIIIALMNIT